MESCSCCDSRRGFLKITSLLLASSTIGNGFLFGSSDEHGPSITPEEAIEKLKEGNKRFIEGASIHPNLTLDRLKETAAHGQKPFVTILACSDSRVPVEQIFDQGVGDIFGIKVAGNVADTDEIGSIEYGIGGHAKTPLVVVLGHTKCGAVTAVVKGEKVGGAIPKLVDNIVPAANKIKATHGGEDESTRIYLTTIENVKQSMADILRRSSDIRKLIKDGKVKLVGAMYDIETGKVDFSIGEHPKQEEYLKPKVKAEHKAEAPVVKRVIVKETPVVEVQVSSKNVDPFNNYHSMY